MKKLLSGFLTLVVICLASCSNKNAERLLKTIPANTDFFAVIEAEKLAADLGDDGQAKLIAILQKNQNSNINWNKFIGKDSQIDFSSPILAFDYNNGRVLTFALKDAAQFRADIEEAAGKKMISASGFWMLEDNTVFCNDDQAWLAGTYPGLTLDNVKSFTGLQKGSSLLSVDFVSEMIEREADFSVLVNAKSMIQKEMNIQASLWFNTLFESGKYLYGFANFEKGKAEGELKILTDKYKPSPLALSLSQIDTSSLKDFQGKGNLFFATAIDSKLIKQLVGQLKSFGAIPAEMINTLEQVEGNIVASANYTTPGKELPGSFALMITFKKDDATQQFANLLRSLLGLSGQDIEVFANGNQLYLMTPTQQGQGISDVISDFKGASMGIVATPNLFSAINADTANAISGFNLKLVPDGKSANIKFTLNTKEGKNALVTLLELSK